MAKWKSMSARSAGRAGSNICLKRKRGVTGETVPKSPKKDNPRQSKYFMKTAKELATDKSGKVFERAFKKLAPVKKPVKAK